MSEHTVLVIDDDEGFRKSVCEILEDAGYSVVGVDSGNHAVRYMQNQPWSWFPWLVVTDLVMDGMGGYQLIRRISDIYPNRQIPIIVCSNLGSLEDISEAEIAGAAAYITKPVDRDKLLDLVPQVTAKDRKHGSFISDYGNRLERK